MLTNISGFPEFLPKDQIIFDDCISKIKTVFERYGFVPLDTSAVEKTTTLLSQGNDKEIYGIHRLGETGEASKDLALRFDLTIPLARYIGQNSGKLTFPFRRYHIAPVWRGERAQKGRYRQFYQCDVDIISNNELPIQNDAELLAIIQDVMEALEFNTFTILINNRKILNGFLDSIGVTNYKEVLRIIDKAQKITELEMKEMLSSACVKEIDKVLNFLNTDFSIDTLKNVTENSLFQEGVKELKEVVETAKTFGLKDGYLKISPSLARGLDYYTATVYEVIIPGFESSVCGGGRYDNLTNKFSKQIFPGVGVSFGISRLIPFIIEKRNASSETTAKILVCNPDDGGLKHIELASKLRKANINTEVFLFNKNLKSQLKYASQKGFPFCVLILDQIYLRNMTTGDQSVLDIEKLKHDPQFFGR